MTRRAALAVGLAALCTAVFWLLLGTQASLPRLERGQEDWSGDFRSFYEPNAEYARARLREGSLPLWNPRQGAGGPFLATLQAGVLYPPNALHVLLPTETAYVALAALHVALAVGLAGALALALGAGGLGAAVAGVAYGTSLQVIGGIYAPPVLYAAAWAPALFLAVDRIARAPRSRDAVALAAVVALMLLCGWPYAFGIAGVGAAFYGGVLLAVGALRARRPPWRACGLLAAGLVLGVLLAAPQLLPTRELVARSCRALGSLLESQAVLVSRPHDPGVFFDLVAQRGFTDGVPGGASVLLAALALFLPGAGRARVALLLGVGALGLFASFPLHAPVYGWLRELPFLGDFRFPFRYRLLTTLALAAAAGVGTTHLQRALGRWRALSLGAGAAALAACVATGALPVLRVVTPFSRSAPERGPIAAALERHGVRLPDGTLQRVYWTGWAEKLVAEDGVFAVHDMEPLTLARTAELLTFFETGRPLTIITLERDRLHDRDPEAPASPFYGRLSLPEDGSRAAILDLLSARWIVSRDPPGWAARRYRPLTPPEAELAVFENAHALPRAYRVPRVLAEPESLAAALRALASEEFDPRRLALVDEPPQGLLLRRGRRVPPPVGSVRIARYEPERVVLETRGPRAALVVLTDAWFPGWEALVDGEPAPLLRANAAFRGVPVSAGPHTVEMRYRPKSLHRGLLLALLGVLGCGALLAAGRAGGRGAPAPPSV